MNNPVHQAGNSQVLFFPQHSWDIRHTKDALGICNACSQIQPFFHSGIPLKRSIKKHFNISAVEFRLILRSHQYVDTVKQHVFILRTPFA